MNYVHDKMAVEYIKQVRQHLRNCVMREGLAESRRFCQPLIRENLDAISPLNHIKFIWDEEELEKYKNGYYLDHIPVRKPATYTHFDWVGKSTPEGYTGPDPLAEGQSRYRDTYNAQKGQKARVNWAGVGA